MCVSGLWIYWETRGSLRDNMALEQSAGAPAHILISLQAASVVSFGEIADEVQELEPHG